MPKKTKKKHSKAVKFLKTNPYSIVLISAILFLFLIGFVYVFYNFRTPKQHSIEEHDLNNSYNEVKPVKLGSTPTPTILDSTPTSGTTLTPTVSQLPTVLFNGPSIKDKDSYVEYSYTVKLNDEADNKYSSISYNINVDGCQENDIYETQTRFSGTLNKSSGLSREFTIAIKSDYLKSKSDLRSDPYILSSNGSSILNGVIGVPRCKSQADNGNFSISGPDIDKNLVSGKVHFEYSFEMDGDARNILEKGFTHKIDHDCEKWMDGKDYFESSWDEGELGNVGFAVNIDDDAFGDDLTEGSSYKIYDKDGKVVFSGNVSVPKCKD